MVREAKCLVIVIVLGLQFCSDNPSEWNTWIMMASEAGDRSLEVRE